MRYASINVVIFDDNSEGGRSHVGIMYQKKRQRQCVRRDSFLIV